MGHNLVYEQFATALSTLAATVFLRYRPHSEVAKDKNRAIVENG